MGQPAFVIVRVTERQKTTSALLSCWRLAPLGLWVFRSNTLFAVSKTVVMSVSLDVVVFGEGSVVRLPLQFFFQLI